MARFMLFSAFLVVSPMWFVEPKQQEHKKLFFPVVLAMSCDHLHVVYMHSARFLLLVNAQDMFCGRSQHRPQLSNQHANIYTAIPALGGTNPAFCELVSFRHDGVQCICRWT